MNGLSQCGRLQKYLNDTCVIPVSEAVSPAILNEFLDAQDLSKQRKLFDELPLQKIKLIIRQVLLYYKLGRDCKHSLFISRYVIHESEWNCSEILHEYVSPYSRKIILGQPITCGGAV